MTERLISAELRGEVRRRDDERRLRKVLGVSGDEQGIVASRGKSYAVEDSVVRVGEPKIVGLCNCVNVRLCRARRSFSRSRGLSITNGMRRSLRVLRAKTTNAVVIDMPTLLQNSLKSLLRSSSMRMLNVDCDILCSPVFKNEHIVSYSAACCKQGGNLAEHPQFFLITDNNTTN